MKSVVITGHRDLSPDDVVKVRMVMRVLVGKEHIGRIYLGGARGADTEALKAAVEFRKGKKPELVVVLPNVIDDQPAEAREWIRKADKVIEMGRKITPDDNYAAYHARNEHMVDAARVDSVDSVLVAFWNGLKTNGTGSCVSYARRKELKVEIIQISAVKK